MESQCLHPEYYLLVPGPRWSCVPDQQNSTPTKDKNLRGLRGVSLACAEYRRWMQADEFLSHQVS